MKSALKVIALSIGLTVAATPALAHGPGPIGPLVGLGAAVVGGLVGAVVHPGPGPGPHRVAAPAPGPGPRFARGPVAPVPPAPRILP